MQSTQLTGGIFSAKNAPLNEMFLERKQEKIEPDASPPGYAMAQVMANQLRIVRGLNGAIEAINASGANDLKPVEIKVNQKLFAQKWKSILDAEFVRRSHALEQTSPDDATYDSTSFFSDS